MVAALNRVSERETGPAFAALPTTDQWPRSGASCPPPTAVRVLADVNNDGAVDHIVTVRVAIDDVNKNGRFDVGIDRLILSPDQLERVDRSAPLRFSDANWREAVREARRQL